MNILFVIFLLIMLVICFFINSNSLRDKFQSSTAVKCPKKVKSTKPIICPTDCGEPVNLEPADIPNSFYWTCVKSPTELNDN